MNLSLIIPVYNSKATLVELVSRLAEVLATLDIEDYEVILINDGSQDHSWEVISQLVRTYKWVHGLNLMRNYGQHNALLAGIRTAQYEIIVTLDDDLQNPPEEIPKLLAKLNEGYDVVYGTPQIEEHGLWRDIASKMTKLALQSVMGIETARHASAFRAFRTQLRQAFTDYHSPFVCIDVLLTWGTTCFTAIEVYYQPRQIGRSNYTFRKLVIHAFNMITGFSTWPLQLASLMGFAFTFFGLGIFIYVLARYFIEGSSVAGFPFLASIIAIFSGVQLFALGIIGEYLGRLHSKIVTKPSYIIKDRYY